MPKSKRGRLVHLSKVEKKGKDHTLKTFANIQECVSKYPYIYVFSVDNMRNVYLKDVRTQLVDSRLFFGKTKVMKKALGSDPATEPAENTHKLTVAAAGEEDYFNGDIGLLFSPRTPEQVQDYFSSFRPLDYARAGTPATRSFTIPAGIVHSRGGEVPEEEDIPMAHSMEPSLRKLGPPTRLVKGKIHLENDYPVCTEGELLGSGQTTLLKMFGITTAEFKVDILAWWSAEDQTVRKLKQKATDATAMDVDI